MNDHFFPEEQLPHAGITNQDAILKRLLEYFLTRTELPHNQPTLVTATLFHRLYRYVVAEGYGE